MGIHENREMFSPRQLLCWPHSSFPHFPCVPETRLHEKETEARITRGGTIAPTMAGYVLLSTQAPSYFHPSEFIGTPDLCKFAFSERSTWLHGTLGIPGIFNLKAGLCPPKGTIVFSYWRGEISNKNIFLPDSNKVFSYWTKSSVLVDNHHHWH